MATKRQLTKDDIKLIATQWTSKTREELADLIGCSTSSISHIVKVMRDNGWDLPKKRAKGVIHGLILEVLDEL